MNNTFEHLTGNLFQIKWLALVFVRQNHCSKYQLARNQTEDNFFDPSNTSEISRIFIFNPVPS